MREFCSFRSFDPPPELRLILACLRITPDAKEVQQIEELSRAKIDWPDFLRWVDRHRVAPLVYQNLRRYGGNGVPAAAISALRSRFESNSHRSLANAGELVRLAKLFQENGLGFIPLKGSTLALQVYGNLAGRHAGDIDLLVEPSQVELADRLLQISYRRIMPGFQLSPSQRRRFLRLMHHFEYLGDQSNLRIELHWRSIPNRPPPFMDLTRLHRRASTVALAGFRLPAMSLPDNFLYLCGHGAHHFWFRLFWLVDLAEMMRRNPAIDWPRLMTLATEAGMRRPLALGVILAHELLDVPLPEVIRTYALQDQKVSVSAKAALRFMLCPQPENPPLSLSLQINVCRLRCGNPFRQKLKILQEILIGQDWKNVGLPDSLFFLYYILRFPLWLQRRLCSRRNQMVRNKTRCKDD
jgi:hypothetical protein